MDSFSIFFRGKPSDDEICTAVLATGAGAYCRAPDEIVASRQKAHVWLYSYSVADLPSREDWPIPKHDVGSILSVLVGREEESSALAIEIAHQLAVELGGVISWGGHEYWRGLYQKAYRHDPSD
jgi:hypothetical protein